MGTSIGKALYKSWEAPVWASGSALARASEAPWHKCWEAPVQAPGRAPVQALGNPSTSVRTPQQKSRHTPVEVLTTRGKKNNNLPMSEEISHSWLWFHLGYQHQSPGEKSLILTNGTMNNVAWKTASAITSFSYRFQCITFSISFEQWTEDNLIFWKYKTSRVGYINHVLH